MDFSISEEQQLLRDSIEKYVREHCDVERHIRLRATETGFDADCWQAFAELGWLCIPFAEEDGGLGGRPEQLLTFSSLFCFLILYIIIVFCCLFI